MIVLLPGLFVLGAGAGLYAGLSQAGPVTAGPEIPSAPAEESEAVAEAAAGHGERQEVDVGRITVTIPGAQGGGTLHMLVAPLVVAYPAAGEEGHGGGEGGPADARKAQLRDTFIEYLSQLEESEVRGSAGLASMREELLRRTRAVAPDLNAEAVLIQDFLIQ